MKAKLTLLLITILSCFSQVNAQNTFPSTGRAGIYTTSPVTSLQVNGGARFGTLSNYANIDSATGNLSFAGTSAYQVGGNKYAFQYSGNPNYGLFFNATNIQYEFRNNTGAPTFYVGANNGNGVFKGNLKIGAYTLPSTDGTSGQTLTTNGSGNVSWSTISGGGSQWTTSGSNIYYNTGNVGIGTSTPTQALEVKGDAKFNGVIVGRGSGNIISNTAIGNNALHANTTGYNNVANGSYALYNNTTGFNNIAIGRYSLYNNTTGNDQVAIGDSALYSSDFSNIYFPNTAVGSKALFFNTQGYSNTAVGYEALYSNFTGADNTAMGSSALFSNNYGELNTAIGQTTLYYNTSGNANTALGDAALDHNTTANNNVAIGEASLFLNTTGYSNTAVGVQSLASNVTGFSNTAIGDSAAFDDVNAVVNTEIGTWAGYGVANGSANTFVGYYSGPVTAGLSNCTALGNIAIPTASNQVRVGNDNITSIGGKVGWTTFSDGRFKKNIKENVPGLEFINQLKPITYTLDITGIKQFKGEDKKEAANNQKTDNALEEKTIHTGFVAQDVETTAKKMNYDFDGVDAAKNDKDLYGLRYSEFVVPLVKAVQELSKQNDSLQKQNDDLKTRMDKLEAIVLSSSSNSSVITSPKNSSQNVELNGATTLAQNIPNPFSNSTTINYYLPLNNGNAYINFYGLNGTILKSIKLAGNGKGNINLKASELPSGAYRYTLFVDGKMIDSKQMILAK